MLPEIQYPIIQLPVSSLGRKVKARPFTVREEKLLLIAALTKDQEEIISVTKQVINNCLLEPVDLDALPFFDIDMMFITLRAKSISNTTEVQYKCKNTLSDGSVCRAVFPVTIDLEKTELVSSGLSNKIELSSKLGVKMRYPTYSEMKRVSTLNDEIEFILASIEYIYTDTEIFTKKDYTPEQYLEFVQKLTTSQYSKLSEWISNFPKFEINTSGTCPSCGYVHSIKFRDFQSFFR